MSETESMTESGRKLYRIRLNILQMLKDRGYDVADTDLNMTKQQFIHKFGEDPSRDNLTFGKFKLDDPNDQIMVVFPKNAALGVKTVKEYIEGMAKSNIVRTIVVVQKKINSFAQRAITESTKYRIEAFMEMELLFNVYKHVLVPEHQVLTKEEKNTLLERYKLKESQLPRMQSVDPIAKYFGLQRGQVVKIIRPSETAGRYMTYRYVI